jgi:hypothetical protein
MPLRDSMEFLLQQRNQTRQRRFVAISPRQEQARDVGKRFGNAGILRRFPRVLRDRYRETVPKAASSTVNDQSRFADSTTTWKTRGSSAV